VGRLLEYRHPRPSVRILPSITGDFSARGAVHGETGVRAEFLDLAPGRIDLESGIRAPPFAPGRAGYVSVSWHPFVIRL